jgi:SAM-dependent methyltransferase
MIYTQQEFLKLFNFNKTISFADFGKRLSVLNGSDTSGQFLVRSDLDTFVARVAKKDNRGARLNDYKQKLYKMIVQEPEVALTEWYNRTVAITESVDHYFQIPDAKILDGNTFAGRTHAKYGRLCKNINFENFYNTKKLYSNDFEYVVGLMKAMFEDFKLRNSLVGPAFFDHICKIDNDYGQFWTDFMMGCNRASIFNPVTYRGIMEELFEGDTIFAPCMGWNAYQLGFYNSKWKKFIATDVIPEVVDNGRKLHAEWQQYRDASLFEIDNKEVDLYLCPSEELNKRHNFARKYAEQVDAVLFSPPYYDLEIYPGEEQSYTNYPDYADWLMNYWEATVMTAKQVLKPGGKFAFVISNYRNKAKQEVTISQDMRDIAEAHFGAPTHYKVQWSAIAGSRQAKKTRDGNFEDLWLFQKDINPN